MCVYPYVYVRTYILMCVRISLCVYIRMYVLTYVCVYILMCVRISLCVYILMCVYPYECAKMGIVGLVAFLTNCEPYVRMYVCTYIHFTCGHADMYVHTCTNVHHVYGWLFSIVYRSTWLKIHTLVL